MLSRITYIACHRVSLCSGIVLGPRVHICAYARHLHQQGPQVLASFAGWTCFNSCALVTKLMAGVYDLHKGHHPA